MELDIMPQKMMENEDLSPIRDRDENMESMKKYPRHRHSVEMKLDCIKRIENGETMKAISEEVGVARCTIRSWVKNKDNLLTPKVMRIHNSDSELTIKQEPGASDVESNGKGPDGSGNLIPLGMKPRPKPRPKPKLKMPGPREPDIPQLVNNSLLKWYEYCQQRGIAVTRAHFEEKTDAFFKKHGIENFYMTNEWLIKWCKQHGFRVLSETLESIPIVQITDGDFQRELKNTLGCTDYQKCQVFNCSVLSWSYKSLPLSLGYQVEREHPQDDYMRVFSFSNADLSLKVPLICTLNSGKKKFWKNEFNLPLYSTETDAERLDSTVFTHWLNQEFSPHVIKFLSEKNLPMKVLLILDKDIFEAPKLPVEFTGLKTIIVSKTSSFLVRPFDSELVALMKNCKRSFLKKVNNMIQENNTVPLIQHLDSINNGHFLAWIKMHWKRGPDGISEPTDTQLVRCLPGGKILSLETIERWFRRCQPEIIEKKEMPNVVIKSECDTDAISSEEAKGCLDKLISYFSFHKMLENEEMQVFNNAKQRITDMLEVNRVV
ncbi:tigger transposable element-derived protein 4-like [Diachasmimorpha longicaudata]|uniref:tigger transposable element-derived protein 4-like n=1 Tax=Diachasmimorpha longicaudata TaxID=58733 RepID=UPI0030B8900A